MLDELRTLGPTGPLGPLGELGPYGPLGPLGELGPLALKDAVLQVLRSHGWVSTDVTAAPDEPGTGLLTNALLLVTYVPIEHTERVLAALADAGAGAIGAYDSCAFVSRGTGQFRPLAGANPAIGEIGRLERVEEDRVELVVPVGRHAEVLAALKAAHPYEVPAYALIPVVI